MMLLLKIVGTLALAILFLGIGDWIARMYRGRRDRAPVEEPVPAASDPSKSSDHYLDPDTAKAVYELIHKAHVKDEWIRVVAETVHDRETNRKRTMLHAGMGRRKPSDVFEMVVSLPVGCYRIQLIEGGFVKGSRVFRVKSKDSAEPSDE